MHYAPVGSQSVDDDYFGIRVTFGHGKKILAVSPACALVSVECRDYVVFGVVETEQS